MEVEGVLSMKLSESVDTFVRFGSSERTLLDLIDGWCGHVMKIFDDASGPFDIARTVDDLIASLCLLDAIQRGIDRQNQNATSIAAVAAADEL